MAETRPLNPWQWQDQYGFSQAIEVKEAQRVVYCAGQTSTDADGNPQHAGDMARQILLALDNLETVLSEGGLKLSNVVRLNYYTTNVAAFMAAAPHFVPRLHEAGCKPSATLLQVAGLFHPDIMVELEATAVA